VDAGAIIVTGVVENRGQPLAVFADVRAFDGTGRQIGQATAPLSPTLVPAGGTASFEVRVAVDGLVRRYAVTIRPTDRPGVALVTATAELKDRDLQQVGPLVARQLQVSVQSLRAVPTPSGLVVVVTNPTPLPVASAVVDVELDVTCRVGAAGGTPRVIEERWTGSATVQGVPPGGSARAPVALSGGVCLEFLAWSPRTRVGEVRIGE
jgi:hypothetical protein